MARPADFPARTGGLVRLVLDLRLVTLLLTLTTLLVNHHHVRPVVWPTLALAFMSYLPLRRWDQVAPVVMRHPLVLFADVCVAGAVLLLAGTDGPFVYFTLSTALLAGVLYGWIGASLFSALLLCEYWWAVSIHHALGLDGSGFQLIIGTPALYPIAGAAGAAVRGLLIREAGTEAALATAAERARLAREMHDSVAKTLHGISLSAAALPMWVRTSPARAEEEARELANAAEVAATEARQLIVGLRTDALDGDLAELVTQTADRWSGAAPFTIVTDAQDVGSVDVDTRWELISVLREALHNVERHACAQLVRVSLGTHRQDLVLSVEDDGCGFSPPRRLGELPRDGHYGVVGMAERAARVGGRLELHSRPGDGTTVTAVVPRRPPTARA